MATVTATITNAGEVDGAEIAQLYVSYPSSAPETPPRQLRGFAKLKLAAGEAGTATFNIRRKDINGEDRGGGRLTASVGADDGRSQSLASQS